MINVEAAVGQLTLQNGGNSAIDARSCRRIPLAIDGGMKPQFAEDVIGFEGRVRGKMCPPVPFAGLPAEQGSCSALNRFLHRGTQRTGCLNPVLHLYAR